MDKLVMVTLVALIMGGIYIGAYGGAYLVLATSPSSPTTGTITTTQVPSTTFTTQPTQTRTSTSSTQATSTTTTQTPSTTTSTQQSTTGASVVYTAVMDDKGWNGSKLLVLNAKLGQQVTINIIYNDTTGGQHPLFITGPASIPGPTVDATHTTGSIQFTPTVSGTYAVVCLNPDCAIHNAISGTLEIVVK